MNYDVVIGIEIHCELKTKTKIFSGAPVSFAAAPNSCVNEIDLAYPGTLPCVNKGAVELAIRACSALNMEIDPLIKFDRKNYFYSDLARGYQNTQQFFPIGSHGVVEIETEEGTKAIRVNRIHMEEDTAKQFHYPQGTFIDFNRSGTPLIEIVSEPDMSSGKEAAAYVEKLRSILYYMDVSDCKMEEGSMRCDINISLKEKGSDQYGVRVEIKNINSIRNVQRAIDYEIMRQSKALEEGEEIIQSTRRFDEASGTTIMMRKKEGSVDYKYFPEPNMFPILIDSAWIKNIQENLPELPQVRKDKYINEYKLGEKDAQLLIDNKELSDYYNLVVKHTNEYKTAANWVIVEMMAYLNKENISIDKNPLNPKHLADMIAMIKGGEISGKQAKVVFEEMMKGKEPKKVVEEKGMKQVSDTGAILAIVNQVLDANPQSIEDFKNGKDRAVKFLMGQVMKLSKGQANPAMANQMVLEELKKR